MALFRHISRIYVLFLRVEEIGRVADPDALKSGNPDPGRSKEYEVFNNDEFRL
jgi:hypothetical protein